MKTAVTFLLYLIFSAPAYNPSGATTQQFYKEEFVNTDTIAAPENGITEIITQNSFDDAPPCNGNGVVTFVNSSSKPLWLYYWYADDVRNASNECRIRRLWRKLDSGSNQFTILKEKTLIFRICTSTECENSVVKQFGIVNYCKVNNGTVQVE